MVSQPDHFSFQENEVPCVRGYKNYFPDIEHAMLIETFFHQCPHFRLVVASTHFFAIGIIIKISITSLTPALLKCMNPKFLDESVPISIEITIPTDAQDVDIATRNRH